MRRPNGYQNHQNQNSFVNKTPKNVSHNTLLESNGPAGKVRGTVQQLMDRYTSLGRDAHAASDTMQAQDFFQHAEHYRRLLNSFSGPQHVSEPHAPFEREPEPVFEEEAHVRTATRNAPNDPQKAKRRRPLPARSQDQETP